MPTRIRKVKTNCAPIKSQKNPLPPLPPAAGLRVNLSPFKLGWSLWLHYRPSLQTGRRKDRYSRQDQRKKMFVIIRISVRRVGNNRDFPKFLTHLLSFLRFRRAAMPSAESVYSRFSSAPWSRMTRPWSSGASTTGPTLPRSTRR